MVFTNASGKKQSELVKPSQAPCIVPSRFVAFPSYNYLSFSVPLFFFPLILREDPTVVQFTWNSASLAYATIVLELWARAECLTSF